MNTYTIQLLVDEHLLETSTVSSPSASAASNPPNSNHPTIPMSSTALIIRPADAPDIHVLECDGPCYDLKFAEVHRYPGDFQDAALPDHSKSPPPAIWALEHNNARRIYRLVKHAADHNGGWLSQRHLLEIRARLKLIAPFCDEDF